VPLATSPWRAALFHVIMSDPFDMMIIGIIIANVLVMALTHANMSHSWQNFMSYSNLGFTAAFTLEACLKLLVLGFKQYFRVSCLPQSDGVVDQEVVC